MRKTHEAESGRNIITAYSIFVYTIHTFCILENEEQAQD
jgi:hypothetical protein